MNVQQQREHARITAIRRAEMAVDVQAAIERYIDVIHGVEVTTQAEWEVGAFLVEQLRRSLAHCTAEREAALDKVRTIDDTLAAASRVERQPAEIP